MFILAAGELFKVSSIYLFIDILLLVAYTKIFLWSSGDRRILKLPLNATSGSLPSDLHTSR